MPLYEYVCDSCGYAFERLQSFGDEPLTECPRCACSVRRVISPVGVIFKGSGWYITDNRRHLSGRNSPALADKGKSHSGEASEGSSPAKDKATGTEPAAAKTSSGDKPG